MKKILFCLIFILTIILCGYGFEYKVFDGNSKKEISFFNMVNDISSRFNVIFVGEKHDDVYSHILELRILTNIYRNNKKTALSLEMFERDVQKYLDLFLDNSISLKKFLKLSRPWGNFNTDYYPCVLFAKNHKLPVIAANIPRRYASLLAKKGYNEFMKLPATDKIYIADFPVFTKGEYYNNFIKTMKMNMGGHGSNNMLERIYMAQCIKDDTMAESINKFLISHSEYTVVHFNGSFHSDFSLGTVEKLKILNNELKICVISIVPCLNKLPEFIPQEDKNRGDYIIYCPRKSNSKRLPIPRNMFKKIQK